jgi:hypothetical protein
VRLNVQRGGVNPALPIIADGGQRRGEPTARRQGKTTTAPPPLYGIRVLTVETEVGRESPEEGAA